MPHEDQVLTERQAEKLNIGVWAAGGIMVFLLSQAVVVTLWLSGIKHSVSLVDQKVEEVQDNQASGQQRAEQRQAATEKRIDEVVTISRDRNTALDARIRPLETQSAATTATLQAINNSLLSLGSDIRDLRQAIRGEDDSVGKLRALIAMPADERIELAQMSDRQQRKAIRRLEVVAGKAKAAPVAAAVEAKPAAPARDPETGQFTRRVSSAPPPIDPLGGGGAADKPLAKMSYAEFEAKRNAEERRTDAFGW